MTEGNIYDSIRAVQMAFNAPKSRYNSFGDYYYRSAEDMEAGLKPLLDEQGLTMFIDDEVVEISGRFYVKATVSVFKGPNMVRCHGYAREVETKTKSDPAQITGMASSYARKYALGGLFLVDDQPDADSQQGASEPSKAKQGPQTQPDPLAAAKGRLWAAVQAYADRSGGDAQKIAEGVRKRKDFAETAEFYEMVAGEFETA